MNKKSIFRLPQKKITSQIEFKEPVLCNLKLALDGIKEDEATVEQKTKYTIPSCVHPFYPPFSPQCSDCLFKNKHDRYLLGSKGYKAKVIK